MYLAAGDALTSSSSFAASGVTDAIRDAQAIVSVADSTARAQAVTDWPTASGAAISAANPVIVYRQDLDSIQTSEDGTNWRTFVSEGDTSWQSPTLVNGWSGTLAVRRTVGGIEIRISALVATSATNELVTTLPAGWRPVASGEASVRFIVTDTSATPAFRRGAINSSGEVQIFNYASTTYYGSIFASVAG